VSDVVWGGRFSSGPDPRMSELIDSLAIDMALLSQDLEATKAHARTLHKAGLLAPDAVAAVDGSCRAIADEVDAGALEPSGEDVHSFVERELTRRLGDVGARIHAGRSRNDLVATDLRLWCKQAATRVTEAVAEVTETIADLAESHAGTVMPGYTHVQHAQPVTLGFHLLAHGFALARDGRRFIAAGTAADVSVLGAGALAGNTLGLDPNVAARELGFDVVFDNAMDAVSDRDFAADLLYASALCGVHLSRLAEEIVMWTSSEFGFARLADPWSTGSSMMPQKRNPDVAELIRGRAALGISSLNGLLVMLKGLPLAYDRDLQEDKRYLFETVPVVEGCLEGMSALLLSLDFDVDRMGAAADRGGTWATDLAEVLVGRGVPFREAHEASGKLVAALDRLGIDLSEATDDLLESVHPAFAEFDRELADATHGVARRDSHGGPAPERVFEQVATLRTITQSLQL
jgi:argininosuccinate lyase